MLWEVDVHDRQHDATAQDLVTAANDLGFDIHSAYAANGWLIEGNMDFDEVRRIGTRLFTDPVTEVCRVAKVGDAELVSMPPGAQGAHNLILHVLPKPGVTDPAAESAKEAMALLGVNATAVRSLKKYWVPAECMTSEQVAEIAWKRLASEAIHEVIIAHLRFPG